MSTEVHYSQYGLYTVKKSVDEGTVGYFYCPWCDNKNVEVGFSLCFANFCICQECLETAAGLSDQWKADDGNGCMKCAKAAKNRKAYQELFYNKSGGVSICAECID